jgi:hypothetical protein
MRFKVHLLAASAILCLHAQAGASTWYVSNTGNDTTALKDNATKPWKTLAGLLKSAGKLGPNDVISLACGGVWYEPLELNTTNASNGIVIQPSAANCTTKPSIRGSVLLAAPTWTAVTGTKLYRTPWTLSDTPAQLFSGKGALQHVLARHPNIGGKLNNYGLMSPVSGDTTMTKLTFDAATRALVDANASTADAFKNVAVRARTEAWRVAPARVAAYDKATGQMTLDRVPFWPHADNPNLNLIDPGDGIVLENAKWMVDEDKEWFYESTPTGGYLYVYATSKPTYANLEATVRSSVVKVTGLNNVKVTGIDLRHSKGSALEIVNGSNVTVDSVNIAYAAVSSPLVGSSTTSTECGEVNALYVGPSLNVYCQVAAAYPTDVKVTKSTFNANGMTALRVYADSSSGVTEGTLLDGNTVQDSGTLAYSDNALSAVVVTGSGAVVKNNTIKNSAYDAIAFGGRGEVITGNTISNYCTRYADCGAIYTFNGSGATPKGRQANTTVSENYIVAGGSEYSYQGVTNALEKDLFSGVYIDGWSNHVSVTNNVIDFTGMGVNTNSGYMNDIGGNWIHGVSKAGIAATDTAEVVSGANFAGYMRGNKVHDNIIYPYNRIVASRQGVTLPVPEVQKAVAQSWIKLDPPQAGPSVVDRMFLNDASLPATSDFYAGNQVYGNTVIDVSNVGSLWRVGYQSIPYYQAELMASTWRTLTHSNDRVVRPVSARMLNPTLIATSTGKRTDKFISNFDAIDNIWGFANGAAVDTYNVLAGIPGCAGSCAQLKLASAGNTLAANYDLSGSAATDFFHYEYFIGGAPKTSGEPSIGRVRVVQAAPAPVYAIYKDMNSDDPRSYQYGKDLNGVSEGRWVEGIFQTGQLAANGSFWLELNPGVDAAKVSTINFDGVRVTRLAASSITASQVYQPTLNSQLFYNPKATGATMSYSCPVANTTCVDQNGVANNGGTLQPGEKVILFAKPPANFSRVIN